MLVHPSDGLAARRHFVPIPLEGKLHLRLCLFGKVTHQTLPVVRAQIAVGETRTHEQERMRVGSFKDLPDLGCHGWWESWRFESESEKGKCQSRSPHQHLPVHQHREEPVAEGSEFFVLGAVAFDEVKEGGNCIVDLF